MDFSIHIPPGGIFPSVSLEGYGTKHGPQLMDPRFRWVLATRAYRVLSDVSDANVSHLELKVVWESQFLSDRKTQSSTEKKPKKCRGEKHLMFVF